MSGASPADAHDLDVAVIGGGFCGAMTAAHLAAAGIDSAVIDPPAARGAGGGDYGLGRGLAYSAPPWLLLNTPSAAMSALPDAPNHFVDYLAARGDVPAFAPRAVYGDYVAHTIRELAGRPLDVRPTRARDVERAGDRLIVTCEDGGRLRARHVVVALGNASPRAPSWAEGLPGFVVDPYRAAMRPADDRTLVLVGTGLTALDVLVSLRHRGHRGRVVMVSRRGLVPLVHGAYPGTATVPAELLAHPTLDALLAWWRANRRAGVSGPPQIDALRPHLPALWAGLSQGDRARFLRHVRARWEVIRHRAPPAIRGVLDAGLADGSVAVIAGRIGGVERAGDGVRVRIGDRSIEAGALVNCIGPERDLARMPSPLVQALLARGLVTRDPLGLGATSDDAGRASPGVWIIGGWRVADRWESLAVPELRGQAQTTARAIAAALA